MGERIDAIKSSAEEAGQVIADSSTGVLQGLMLAAWPVFLLSTVAVVTVAVVRLPRRIFGGSA